jgi:RND family efflux transporter MFP subunit
MSTPRSRRALGIGLVLLVAAAAFAAGALLFKGGGRAAPGEEAGSDTAAPAARYHCPMHPTMVSDRPGDCPICGMRLVPIEDRTSDGEAGRAPADPEAPPPGSSGRRVIYRSTMNPGEVSDRPGKDSMGMDMVAVEVGGPEQPPGTRVEGLAPVRIPARKQQMIGVRTTVVRRMPFVRTLRTVGRVTADETRLHHIHVKTAGWIEMLHVNATGERVRKGQPLLDFYSPELLATQEEYLLAVRARAELGAGGLPEVVRSADELVESARRRLRLFDLTEEQIRELESRGTASRTVTLYAPISGHVLQRNVTHGQKIDPDTTLLDIADLSRVWVLGSIYEYELPFVRLGQEATITLSYLAGRVYRGRVGLIYPVLEEGTRTAQVRIEFDNPGFELKPGMYTDVAIRGDLGARLSVPESAVLSSGTRNIVFVAGDEGAFEPREVRIGLRLPDALEILDGLREGESVVTSGTFFVDSESKLQAAMEAATSQKPAPGHVH